MRRVIAFPCGGETLVGALDDAAGPTGLLIVSGGNEIRCGAHRGMASLASRLAETGVPVFRFDRRGIGDSTGENQGFASSRDDIAAASRCFRDRCPQLTRVIGFGNCDAASALAMFGRDAGLDGLILANPWVIETSGDLPPAAAIRARYAERLRDPREWRRLLGGGVNLGKLIKGLGRIASTGTEPSTPLEDAVFDGIDSLPATVIVAERDATAIAFLNAARRRRWSGTLVSIDTASHSFAKPGDDAALLVAIRAAIG